MDNNSGYSSNRGNDYLGVNKIGKNIRKSPLHQPNFANPARQPPQPQVYNINKNDFQSIVQQLTGSPSRHSQEPLPRPPPNSKPPSMRMQRIRPSPLTPLNVTRPRMSITHAPVQEQLPPHRPPVHGPGSYNGGGNARPPYRGQQQPPPAQPIAESPISAYMRYLQHSIMDPAAQGPPHPQAHPPYHQNHQGQNQSQMHGPQQQQQQSSGLLPYPLPSPRMNGPPHHMNGGPPLPSPRMNGPPPPLPSPRMNGPPPALPSPTSQYLLPSPSGYLNLLSPRSPYPLLSPGYQHPPPFSPNFSFSPMTQPGAFGHGPQPQPPPSPGVGFPSPGFFSFPSPRWRE